jgi:beta-galactosidase
MKVIEVSSLRPGLFEKVTGKVSGTAEKWIEHIETSAEVLARGAQKQPLFIANGNHHYLACWADEKLLAAAMKHVTAKAKLKTITLPEHIRLRRRGAMLFAFNYGSKPWTLSAKGKLALGKSVVPPQGVAAIKL